MSRRATWWGPAPAPIVRISAPGLGLPLLQGKGGGESTASIVVRVCSRRSPTMRPDGFRWVPSAAATVYSVAVTSATTTGAASSPFSEEKSFAEAEGTEPGAGKRKGTEGGQMFAPRFDGLRFIETLVTAHR